MVGDARHFPLIVVTWFGETNEQIFRSFQEWFLALIDRSNREQTMLAVVNDARSAKRPPPTVRKAMTELTDAMVDHASGNIPESIVVIDNALIRGALTAMRWITDKSWGVRAVPSLEQGLREAMHMLELEGIEAPQLDPASYAPHSMPECDGDTSSAG